MAFQRFSLRGFSDSFTVRRTVNLIGERYSCSAELYEGRHLRRRIDSIRSFVPAFSGEVAGDEMTAEFQRQLLERHGLRG